jgi:crossover junction endodeoxyribonuclease RuvC
MRVTIAAMSLIAGCDPGLSGALFFIDPERPATGEAVDLPIHVLTRGGKKKRELDIAGLVGILAEHPIDHAFVEQVSSMPGQGLSSTFSFGKTFGIILGVLSALRLPYTLVVPIRWKRAMHVLKDKDAARARASQLLPAAAHQWRFKKDHGRAEACLLALCGLRLSGAPLETAKKPHAAETGDGEMLVSDDVSGLWR